MTTSELSWNCQEGVRASRRCLAASDISRCTELAPAPRSSRPALSCPFGLWPNQRRGYFPTASDPFLFPSMLAGRRPDYQREYRPLPYLTALPLTQGWRNTKWSVTLPGSKYRNPSPHAWPLTPSQMRLGVFSGFRGGADWRKSVGRPMAPSSQPITGRPLSTFSSPSSVCRSASHTGLALSFALSLSWGPGFLSLLVS